MPFISRVGRPGLLATAARTAVVAGTATAVSGAVGRRQHERAAAGAAAAAQASQPVPVPQPVPSAAPVAPPSADLLDQLQQLGAMHQQGLLSADEFAVAKQRLLGA